MLVKVGEVAKFGSSCPVVLPLRKVVVVDNTKKGKNRRYASLCIAMAIFCSLNIDLIPQVGLVQFNIALRSA